MLRLQKFMTLALAAGMVAACAGPQTTLDNEWMSPAARQQPPLKKVATIFLSPNQTMRHSGEDQLARDLYQTGVQATPGYMIFGDNPQDLDLESMKAKLRQMGYDGVVTLRVVDRQQDVESVPATFDYYWGYWGPSYYGTYWPGYTYTETVYRLEAAAYSLRTGQLVWSGLTKTVDPSSAHDLVGQTSEVVASQLVKRGLSG